MCERAVPVSVSVPPILVPYPSRPILTLDHTRLIAPVHRKDRARMLHTVMYMHFRHRVTLKQTEYQSVERSQSSPS